MNKIFTRLTLLLVLVFTLPFAVSAQDAPKPDAPAAGAGSGQVTLTGKVLDTESGEPLAGVNVVLKGKVVGTATNVQGVFTLKVNVSLPVTLVISMIGYEAQEIEVKDVAQPIEVKLLEQTMLGQEVVVSASRVEENVLRAPVSVEKLDILSIKETPSLNFFDALANLKAVDAVTSSLGFRVYNTRGFNNPVNTRFVQLVDGVDMQAPSLNVAVGNFLGLSDLDVESAELIPGAASALYGSAAFNGILLTRSKNPFLYKGLSASLRTGINHVGSGGTPGVQPYNEAALRYANTIGERFAFKVNVSGFQGTDWYANSTMNQETGFQGVGGRERPGYNGLNIYGDEASAGVLLPIGPSNSAVRVTRTGYAEKDLVDYGVKNFKADGSVHYRINNNLELNYGYRIGYGTTVYTGFNRYSFRNLDQQLHRVELKGADFFVRGYTTLENSNETYDAGFTAINMERQWKDNSLWGQEYASAFQGLVPGIAAGDHLAARGFADLGRPEPGSPAFNRLFDRVTSTTNFSRGSRFSVNSRLYHAEGMYDLSKYTKKVANVQVGGSYRVYDLNSKGTLFPDTTGNDITIHEYGAYLQVSRSFFQEKLKLSGSLRYDKNEQVAEGRTTPRFSAVYEVKKNHNIRASYQTGFRMPSTQELFIDLELGQVKLLGGLPNVYNRYNVNQYNVTQSSAAAYGAAVASGIAGGQAQLQALSANLGLLQQHRFGSIKPEGLQSYELGYKGVLWEKLMVDFASYYSIYKDFIAARIVVVPTSASAIDPLGVGRNIANGDFQVYGVYDNASSEVYSYGSALGLTYNLSRGYVMGANYTFARLDLAGQQDELLTAFNTPEHKTNFTFGNRDVYKNIGFNVAWKWNDSFYWKSSFSEGVVPAYSTFDAQVTVKVPSIKSLVKVGGTNLLNNRYTQLFGGPQIGALYYVGITFDQFAN